MNLQSIFNILFTKLFFSNIKTSYKDLYPNMRVPILVLYSFPEISWSKYFESLLIPSFYCSLCLFLTLLRTSYKDVSPWSKYPVSLLIWRLSCQLGVSQTLKSAGRSEKRFAFETFPSFDSNFVSSKYKQTQK